MPTPLLSICRLMPPAALCLALLPTIALGTETDEPRPERHLHVLFDPVVRQVQRQNVGVYGPHPDMALEFQWEPQAGNWPGVTDTGLADGPGRIVWRVPGTADYDPRAAHHWYQGTLSAGRFHGVGSLHYRDGSYYQGTWVDGALAGPGVHLDASGNRYEGGFVNGQRSGEGVLRGRDGSVLTGAFEGGERHGPGTLKLPGVAEFAVVFERDRMVDSARPDILPDATLKGLLRAQSGGDAGKTRMSVVIDQRTTADQYMQYTHFVDGDEVLIYPSDPEMQAAWEGNGKISMPYIIGETSDSDWDETHAFALIDLATTDQSRVKLDALDLAVVQSVPHLRPLLDVEGHAGCVGFRPSFNFRNFGWGQVENAVARVRFRNPNSYDYENPDAARPGTTWFEVPVGGFEDGTDVSVRDVLIAAGVDVGALENRRFTCPGVDQLDTCRAEAIASVDMGALTGFVDGWAGVTTDMEGELTYQWTDAFGTRHTEVETFENEIMLSAIETPTSLAECGGAGAYSTEAPTFIDVELPATGQNYRIGLPQRGNPNISSLIQGVKLSSDRSSMHLLQAEARFADGSIRTTAPVRLFFFRPRMSRFQSQMTPSACYLDPDAFGGC